MTKYEFIQLISGKTGLNPRLAVNNYEAIKLKYPEQFSEIMMHWPSSSAFPEQLYTWVNELEEYPQCKYCGKPVTHFYGFTKGYGNFCSKECKIKQTTQSVQKTFDVKWNGHPLKNQAIRDKSRETCLQKYGVSNGHNKEVNHKIKETSLKNYGVEHHMQSPNFINELKNHYLESIGVSWTSKLDKSKETYKQTCLKKYGTESHLQETTVRKKIRTTVKENNWEGFIDKLSKRFIIPLFNKEYFINEQAHFQYKCIKCNTIWESDFSYEQKICCKHCYETKQTKAEFELLEFLKEFGAERSNRTVIGPKELDIYLPSHKLAIEYNGLYWHSELYAEPDSLLNKTNLCKKQGVQLLHIFENEWITKQEIVKSIILSKLGVYKQRIFARKCSHRALNNEEYKKFCSDNHLQGYAIAPIRIGLFYDNELVMLVSAAKSRFKQNETELVRVCSLLNTQVIGGLSKLLQYLPKNLITYCDLRYSNGSGYIKNGFKVVGQSNPNYWYWKNNSMLLESRMKYQKHKLPNILENFDPALTEIENMHNNGYYRIFDCGNLKLQQE